MDPNGVLIMLCVFQLPILLAAPSGFKSSADMESLQDVIAQLEDVVFKLKDFSRNFQESSINRGDSVGLLKKLGQISQADDVQLPSSLAQTSNKEEVSLKEAIEYLVSLAKQKKQEKRDHDIPFPLAEKIKD